MRSSFETLKSSLVFTKINIHARQRTCTCSTVKTVDLAHIIPPSRWRGTDGICVLGRAPVSVSRYSPLPPPLLWHMGCIGIWVCHKHPFLLIFCWIDCSGFIVRLEKFSIIWRRHHIAGEGLQNLDLCSALMAIEQWGFFNVPHLLCHGACIYNCQIQGHVTLTPIAERLAVELSLPVFTT